MVAIRPNPAAHTAHMATGIQRYRPVLEASMPVEVEATRLPTDMGTHMRPAASGDMRSTIWKYVGRYDTAPMRPMLMRKPTAEVSTKLRSRNSPRGMTGLAARRSAATRQPADATAMQRSPTTCQLSQAKRLPPHDRASTRLQTAAASETMPA